MTQADIIEFIQERLEKIQEWYDRNDFDPQWGGDSREDAEMWTAGRAEQGCLRALAEHAEVTDRVVWIAGLG